MVRPVICTGLLLWSLHPFLGAAAQAPPDTTAAVPLGEIVIESRWQASTNYSRELLPSDRRGSEANLGQVLARHGGIHVHQQGPGATAIPRIRGWDGSQSTLVLDGVALANPQSGQVDLSALPTSFLESATLEHGPGSTQGGLGGTIRLRTIAPEPGGTIRAEAVAGPFGIGRRALALGLAGRSVAGLVAVDLSESASVFPTGSGQVREGAGGDRASLLMKLSRRAGPLRWDGQAFASRSDTRLPGPANAPPGNATQDQDITQAQLRLQSATAAYVVDVRAVAQESASRFEDPDRRTVSSTRSRAFEVHGRLTGPRWTAVAIARQELLMGSPERERTLRLDIQREWTRSPRGPRVSVGLGHRFSSRGLAVTPRLSLHLEHGALLASLSGGRTVRQPTFVERFWAPGGNPNLEPETGWSAEGRLAMARGPLQIALAGFVGRLKNRIVWHPSLVTSGLQVWTPANVGNSVSRGVEVRASVETRSRGLLLDAGFTSATDQTDPGAASFGHQIRYTPRLLVSLETWLMFRGVMMAANAKRTGRRPIASDGSHHEPAYTVTTISISRKWTGLGFSHHISASLHNAANADYAVVRLYPMPARHLTFSYRINLE